MRDDLPVTAVIINYRTADLFERAISSFRQLYPKIRLLLIDNGSRDGKSNSIMTQWKSRQPDHTELRFNTRNIHHGPAMDQALYHTTSPFLLFLDSDCEVFRGGFVELMFDCAVASPLHYAVGKRTWMDGRGFDLPTETPGAIPYIRPICLLIRRETYLTLPRARRHGAPLLKNMREATRRGYVLVDFPIDEYVSHVGRGTASRHGYKLGWKGKLNYLLHKIGI